MSDATNRYCSTTSVLGLSRELLAEMQCDASTDLTEIGGSGIVLTDSVLPYLQHAAAGALSRAVARRGGAIHIDSAIRTLAQQLMLYRWYRGGRCGIRLAARPGQSAHESGLAVDVTDYSAWRSVLTSEGFSWQGSSDPVHFSHAGTDLGSAGVLAFQRLHNRAHPEDRIAEDGVYGPATEARLLAAPADGFGAGTSCGSMPPSMVIDDAGPADAGPADAGMVVPDPDASVPPAFECASAASCGECGGHPECEWCASGARCQASGGTCALSGASCGPLDPCAVASCWSPTFDLSACGSAAIDEDFSSGAYGVHRWSMQAQPLGPITIALSSTGGSWTPALVITDASGVLVYGGEPASPDPNVAITASSAGSVTLEVSAAMTLELYVTGRDIVQAGFSGMLSTSARYHLSGQQTCAAGADPYAGLDLDGMHVPRAGLANATLRGALGVSVEPYGDVVSDGGHDWVSGTMSWFGGPDDTGVTSTETGSISGERLRSLNDPLSPSAAELAANPDQYYYCAMRFDYSPLGVSWWRSARLIVMNPRTGARIVVRPVDWGPNTSTGRIINLSPQSLTDLGVSTDDEVYVAFASPGTPLGPIH